MPRLISFSLTTQQVLGRTKTVTRRKGWKSLKPGTILRAIDKLRWLRSQPPSKTLAMIRVVSVRRERLDAITDEDAGREGFDRNRDAFLGMARRELGLYPENEITRIEFEYLPDNSERT